MQEISVLTDIKINSRWRFIYYVNHQQYENLCKTKIVSRIGCFSKQTAFRIIINTWERTMKMDWSINSNESDSLINRGDFYWARQRQSNFMKYAYYGWWYQWREHLTLWLKFQTSRMNKYVCFCRWSLWRKIKRKKLLGLWSI